MPADRALPPDMPPGTIPIIRSAQAAGTLYTVPANRRLHVVAAWCSIGQPAASPAAGQIEVIVSGLVGDANARVIVGTAVGASSSQTNADSITAPIGVPVPAAGTVSLTLTGAAAATIDGGFWGWEESALVAGGPIGSGAI